MRKKFRSSLFLADIDLHKAMEEIKSVDEIEPPQLKEHQMLA